MMRSSLFMLILAGCSSVTSVDHVTLDERWLPLKRIERDTSIERGVYQTRTPLILTADPNDFLSRSTVDQNSLLAHEQVHAVHQQAMGLHAFVKSYESVEFRRAEEQEGWRAEIRYLIAHGERIHEAEIAAFMSQHYDGAFTMESAFAWVHAEVKAAR